MKFLAVVTQKPDIYNGCSTRKTFLEEKFTLVKMASCGRCNVKKHKEIRNRDQYIVLDISSNIDFMDKR